MVRVINAHDVVKGDVKYYEYAGTSEDDKPTENVSTGSVFVETDTDSVYVYDEDSEQWNQISGGGGGGTGTSMFVVNGSFIDDNYEIIRLDKTAQEILNAAKQGPVFYVFDESDNIVDMATHEMMDYYEYNKTLGTDAYQFHFGSLTFKADTGDVYPQTGGGK